MTKAELINQISLASGFDKKTVGVIVETFMDKVKKNRAVIAELDINRHR